MLLIAGLAVRAALLVFGLWQDAHLKVKYTDIDYEVFTDAAAFVWAGGSPYSRSTYRYSPLLAFLMLPNVALHKACGKLLFCAADLLAARLFQALLAREGVPRRLQSACIALWLFNPLTVTISTRGSGEAVVTCMLLAMLLLLKRGLSASAGAVFGLAVHYRVYPVIYAWPILLHLGLQQAGRPGRAAKDGSTASSSNSAPPPSARLLALFSAQGLAFGASAAAVFLGLGALFYNFYGQPFLQETYLYHATRTDPRHNFSAFFYPAYLASATGDPSARSLGWVFTAAQAVLQLCLGWRFAGDLPFCLLLQTVVLVAFNKVCTAQYFVWYFTFLPLVLPQLLAAQNKGRLGAAVAVWAVAMGHWLFWAYQLEFGGRPLYLAVWAASLLFFAAHVWLIQELVGTKRARGAAPKIKAQ